jgi:hypothetical protein
MNHGIGSTVIDRRTALKTGVSLFAVLTALRVEQPILAQEATLVGSPVAGVEGLYAAVRLRTVKPEEDVDALFDQGDREFVPIVTAVNGFVAWMGLFSDESRSATFFNVFHDKAGSDEATAKSTDYSTSIAHYYVDPKPEVFDGTIAIADGADLNKDVIGAYGVFRIREVKADQDADALIAAVRDEFVPIVSSVAGFVGYWLFYSDVTRAVTSFGIFADKAGADESTVKGTDFSTSHAFYFVDPTPRVVDGTIRAFAGAGM